MHIGGLNRGGREGWEWGGLRLEVVAGTGQAAVTGLTAAAEAMVLLVVV